MKIERLLATIVMLLNQRKVTAKELAAHFEVSLKTIYRDIETLNMSGIPVVSYQGYEGGFCIPDNYKLSRQLLTYNDMVSILTSLRGINSSLKNKDIERVIEKVTALIPNDKKELYERQSKSFVIDISPWGASQHYKNSLQIAHQATTESTLLNFIYTSIKGKTSTRMVEPHTLVFKNFNWYLLAYCRLRQDFRVFRLSRMKQLSRASKHFTRRDCDPLHYFEMENDSRTVAQVVLKFSPKVRVRVEEIFSDEQLHYENDGTIIASFPIPEDDWISSFVLSFADTVEILSPENWRLKVKDTIEKMRDIYTH